MELGLAFRDDRYELLGELGLRIDRYDWLGELGLRDERYDRLGELDSLRLDLWLYSELELRFLRVPLELLLVEEWR
jgi:hypothetical protein